MTEEPGRPSRAAKVRMLDVAALAGVSPATASRTLRGLAKVSPETRQRVLDAARELSYETSPEALGQSGFQGGRRAVAVIVPFVNRWFFSTVTAGAIDLLHGAGWDVLLYHLGSVRDRDSFFERMPLDRRVEGILTLSMPLSENHTLALRALDLPLVSVGSVVPGSPSVGIDEVGAARSAVNHLLHLRHERIGLIGGDAEDPRFQFASLAARRRGYEESLCGAGLAVDESLIAGGCYGHRGGAEAMSQLLSRSVLPTAIFAEYDELAFGALWALRRAGLNVPEDISVVGIDDHEMAAVMELTTVAQQAPQQGEVAAELLLQALEDRESVDLEPVLLPTRLILRGSTAPRAAASVVEGASRG